jgi:2-(1,2-epoxy-1,2-dihydrophenyl)acetyl-CoA isomerase
MTVSDRYGDVSVQIADDRVATVTMHRPPDNYFDQALIASIADAYEALDADDRCRAIVLCSEGKHFCAGAALTRRDDGTVQSGSGRHLYDEAVRLFKTAKPVVASIQGAAIGGGFGLAMSTDFRIGTANTRLAANFARLGFHQGFGLSATLPLVVGHQKALEILYTGRRLPGDECAAIGLLDRLVAPEDLDATAHAFAADIAVSAPLAVTSIRQTMRGHLPDAIRAATDREKVEQDRLRSTADFAEGVRATAERRPPNFEGR